MGWEGLEARLERVPDCFQDIIYSGFFPKDMYSSLEIKAIHWHELKTQERHRGKERRTGGPSYRHIKEIVEYMNRFNQGLSQDQEIFKEIYGKENIFDGLIKEAEKEGIPYDPEKKLIQLPVIAYFAAITHDDLEDDDELNNLIEQYKKEKDERDFLEEKVKERVGWIKRLFFKEKVDYLVLLKDKKNALLKTKKAIEELRDSFWNKRNAEFKLFLDQISKEKPENEVNRLRKKEILDQFRISERILKSLIRHTEERSYVNSMYHFFTKVEHSDKDVLIKSFIKLCDRLVNVGDVKREYNEEEAREYKELFEKNQKLKGKYGEMTFKQVGSSREEIIYNASKSIIVLSSLNRRVLNSEIPKNVFGRDYLGEKFYLNLVLLAKEELIRKTMEILEEQKRDLEGRITQEYIEKTNEKVNLFRKEGGYDQVTSQKREGKKKRFGHGTLELITNKQRLNGYIDELSEEKRVRFLYLTVRNCLEVMDNFRSREKREYGSREKYNDPEHWKFYIIKGLTSKLKPLEVVR